MSTKTAAERAREYRERQKQTTDEGPLVAFLRDTIDDLRRRLDESEKRHRERDESARTRDEQIVTLHERVTNAVTNLAAAIAGSPSGLGGLGGSRSGSPSPSSSPEKERDAREFQDLNGTPRAQGKLSNGTLVPGRLGDEERDADRDGDDRHAVTSQTVTTAAVLDSPKTETRAKKGILGAPLLGELTPEEIERRRRSQLDALAKLEAGE